MTKNNEYTSSIPKKVLLSIFLFGLVLLAGRFIYSQFLGISACLHDGIPAAGGQADLASLDSQTVLNSSSAKNKYGDGDFALQLYRSEETKADVVSFYTELTGNAEISDIILRNADENNISPSLAFALSWEESRFQPKAVNRNSNSVDRGLFQLNNKAFPSLTEEDMFNPEINARNGLSHLRFCLDQSGNEIAALAMYNAGTTKVRNGNTPKRTLDYVSRILAFRENADKYLLQTIATKNL